MGNDLGVIFLSTIITIYLETRKLVYFRISFLNCTSSNISLVINTNYQLVLEKEKKRRAFTSLERKDSVNDQSDTDSD